MARWWPRGRRAAARGSYRELDLPRLRRAPEGRRGCTSSARSRVAGADPLWRSPRGAGEPRSAPWDRGRESVARMPRTGAAEPRSAPWDRRRESLPRMPCPADPDRCLHLRQRAPTRTPPSPRSRLFRRIQDRCASFRQRLSLKAIVPNLTRAPSMSTTVGCDGVEERDLGCFGLAVNEITSTAALSAALSRSRARRARVRHRRASSRPLRSAAGRRTSRTSRCRPRTPAAVASSTDVATARLSSSWRSSLTSMRACVLCAQGLHARQAELRFRPVSERARDRARERRHQAPARVIRRLDSHSLAGAHRRGPDRRGSRLSETRGQSSRTVRRGSRSRSPCLDETLCGAGVARQGVRRRVRLRDRRGKRTVVRRHPRR